jgi:C-lobe and N-lobe beta barrels of Tf-binding protein B
MRLYPVMALVSSAFALAACGGGGGGLSSGVASRANALNVCAINDTSCAPGNTGGTPTTPAVPDTDGDGIPDNVDTDGGVGSGAGGNTPGITTGNRTLAIASSKLDTPNPGATALAVLTSSTTPTQAATEAAILSTNKPKSLKFAINTNSATNSQWAVPIEQTESLRGTRDLTWIEFRHISNAALPKDGFGNPIIVDPNGNPVTYDRDRHAFVYTVDDVVTPTNPVRRFNAYTSVDTKTDFYWSQLTPYMGDKANGSAKEDYRAYNALNLSTTVNRDEALQVWAWSGDSYSAHYINRSGEDSKQHAWTYGGNASTTMPTTGEATYRGRFVGNAKSANWKPKPGSEINPNANWRIQGRSELIATFGTNDIRGTLTPETWTSQQGIEENGGQYTWFTQEAGNTTDGNIAGTPSVGTGLRPNYYEVYDTTITLNGKVKAAAGAPTTGTPILNNFDGTATLNNDYNTANSALLGGFFGANGKEVAGVFSASGVNTDPEGGSNGLNGDRAAYIDMNGSFNGCITATPTGPCLP